VSQPVVADVFRSLAKVLSGSGLRWYVFGAQAVLAYGFPRLTADIDVTIDDGELNDGNATILSILNAGGIVSRAPGFEEMLRSTRLLPLVHAKTGIAIDAVLAAKGIEQDFLSRAVTLSLGGVDVPVLSVEDLIATKVIAGRRKDREDVLGILQRQADNLDMERLRITLRELDDALEEPRATASFERIHRAFKKQRSK
jgi:Nucleotidyltransferase of unknown function (DUF6036)